MLIWWKGLTRRSNNSYISSSIYRKYRIRHRVGTGIELAVTTGENHLLFWSKSAIFTYSLTMTPKLHYYHELDEWQQDNHYILSSYVKETGSYWKCFKSLTYIHNETINIYSHLFPSLVICAAQIVLITSSATDSPTNLWWAKVNIFQFVCGALCCLSLSALFHLLKSHSQRVCKFGNQCDYFGIVIMITSSLISIIAFVFNDHPRWRNTFVALFLVMGAICTKVTFQEKFSTPTYRPFRSLMFILFGLSGVLPVFAAAHEYGPSEAVYRSSAAWLVAEGFFYIAGAVLYALRFPERLTHNEGCLNKSAKGKFDVFGHLHQIFHIMVVIAALCHWRALIDCRDRWLVRNSEQQN